MSINTNYNYYNSYYSQYTQQAAKKEKPSLTSLMDLDEDKTLSADELSNFAAEVNSKTGNTLDLSSIMATYDSDGDGNLSESEQEALNKDKALEKLMASSRPRQMQMMDGPPPSFLSDIDQDGDGSLNSDELTQLLSMFNEATGSSLDLESTLQKYDMDGDGSLSRSEQTEMLKDMAPSPQKSSAASSDDKTILEKQEELRKYIEERIAKKDEDKTLTQEAVTRAENIKLALQRRLSQSIGSYEKNFWFENASTETEQFGA